MSTNQELRQASVRGSTSTTWDYNGDWSALFDQASIAAGPFDGRLLSWINTQLGTSYTGLPDAMQAYAVSQGFLDWSAMGTFSLSAYSAEAVALFAAMSVQPDGARKTLINSCIVSLKSAGVWTKLDVLWILTAHDAQAARLNWVSPLTLSLTEQNSPTFTTDRGYAGDGISAYLSSTFAPGFNSAKAVRDDNALGVWILTSFTGNPIDMGGALYTIDSRVNPTTVTTRNSSSTANANTVASDTSIGHTATNRTGSTGYDLYKNATNLLTVAQVSSAPTNFGFYMLARNNSGTAALFSTRGTAVGWAGQSLTAQNMTDLHSALSTFLTALGN